MPKEIITVSQAKDFDFKAKYEFGVPALLLMENAGRAISEEALKFVSGRKLRVAVFCGKGNNGGDGLCAARHLISSGVPVDIYLCASVREVKREAGANLRIILRMKHKVFTVKQKDIPELAEKIKGYRLIIDALLGVGLNGPARGIIFSAINLINLSGAHVISADIPSGLDADTGRVLGAAVKADSTITFVAKKKCMVIPGIGRLCGKIKVCNIGLPLKG